MKNIFLSASIPLPDRHPKYYKTADIISIRDAVIALTSIVLPKHRIIWGGHPSITPLIYYVIETEIVNEMQRENWDSQFSDEERDQINRELKSIIKNRVILYQSLYFQSDFPKTNDNFNNIVFTANTGNKISSIQIMREKMFTEHEYAAAVFIGGMDGVESEYVMFRKYHPNALVLPIASTGAAAKMVYDALLPDNFKNERLIKDYGYMSLFQKLLIDKI